LIFGDVNFSFYLSITTLLEGQCNVYSNVQGLRVTLVVVVTNFNQYCVVRVLHSTESTHYIRITYK